MKRSFCLLHNNGAIHKTKFHLYSNDMNTQKSYRWDAIGLQTKYKVHTFTALLAKPHLTMGTMVLTSPSTIPPYKDVVIGAAVD